ncbi:MAG: hypothetical protein DI536_16605 [Archangium gephyra]|uniref:Uncharacterized protein n=1 Tax=Archangium gephyra TaxID=48 RepID=A0A2W5TH75_9BACT|nr:MAG: hypothetical protein DI536_16605 [Archangium gephyra]
MCTNVQRRADRLRVLALLGVSLALHALFFLWFASSAVEQPPPYFARPIVLEDIAWVDAQTPEAAPQPEAQPQPQQPVVKSTQKKQATSQPTAPAPTAAGTAGTGTSDVPSNVQGAEGADGPVVARPTLTPSAGFTMSLGTGGLEETPRGTTVRNGPGERPDQRALDEYTGDVLTRKLNAELREQVGLAAVAVGNVPAHFKRYESAMRTALPKTNIDKTPMTAGDVARDVAGIMFNSGPSAEAARRVSDSPLGRSIAGGNVPTPTVDDARSREQMLQMLSASENIRERIQRERLRTVLEMTTDATGALADVAIVVKSGDPRFDESVLHFSRKVARTLPDTDDKMLGTNLWRSRWAFTWEPPDVRVRLLNAWKLADGPAAQ